MTLLTPTQLPDRPPIDVQALKLHRRQTRRLKLFEPALVKMATIRSFVMLDPRNMARNPVMFLVEVGWILTTLVTIESIATGASTGLIVYQAALAVLLLLDGALRQLRRGAGRGSGQGAGAEPAGDASGHDGASAGADRRDDRGLLDRAQAGRSRRRRGRPDHSGRRRDRRRRGLGRRVGDHRRERAGDSRGRRRPLGRDRRNAGALRPHRRRGHRRGWRELPGPDDRPGRRGVAAEDAQRDRADDHPGGVLDHLPDRHGDALSDGPLLRHHAWTSRP